MRSHGLHVGLFVALAALSASPRGSPGIALGLGTLLAVTLGNPLPQAKVWSKPLLQVCVVLLGFGMDLGVILDAGRKGMLFAAISIALTLVAGALLGQWLGIERSISALISAGTAICGGSAIAAVGSVIGASGAEMSVAMGTVFVLNAVALVLFPLLGHALGLTQEQFGLWAGVAIHDVSSVVGAGTAYGPDALHIATAVKLSRTLWIIPITLLAALAFRVRAARPQIPWFIGLFLLASVARGAVPGLAAASVAIVTVARAGFAVVLFFIGAGISLPTLRAVGWRPMAQGVVLWLLISVVALFAAWR